MMSGQAPVRCQRLRTNCISKLAVPIMDEEPAFLSERKGFPQLLRDPETRWAPGNVEMQNPPAIMGNYKKAVENPEPESRDGEEVHRGDGLTMVLQKRLPTLSWLRVFRCPSYPPRHRPFRDIESQFHQLAVNPGSAPGGILSHHAKDQLPRLFRKWFSSARATVAGTPPPIEPEAGTVPANHCFRGDDHQRSLPPWPETFGACPEQSINAVETWLGFSTLKDQELLAQGQILQ